MLKIGRVFSVLFCVYVRREIKVCLLFNTSFTARFQSFKFVLIVICLLGTF